VTREAGTAIRILGPGDEAALEGFLVPRIESSMFLLGNMRTAGLVDQGQPYEGTYAGAIVDGQVKAVVAHFWNGNLVFQAPLHLDALWRLAVRASGRSVRGLIGPADQVEVVASELDITDQDIRLDETERLYRLPLEGLVVPPDLESGRLEGRRMEDQDLDLVAGWHAEFGVESLGEVAGPEAWARARAGVARMMRRGHTWILEDRGRPVATSSFNTAMDEAVQIGGVWTPPELRSQGYGRAAVAASLLAARSAGVRLAVLFTGEDNVPAQRAYEALGFQHIGHYRLLLLRSQSPPPQSGSTSSP
jgi:RimJ/RimL family protein N-acetyltransferase